MPTREAPTPVYQLKITLVGIDPPIWRRLQVPSTIRLCCLHDAFQAVMGWTDSHLHQFEKDGKTWGVPEYDEFGDLELLDESRVPLDKLLQAVGDSLTYLYDFGDSWSHQIVLEKILPSGDPTTKPVCLAGERRCPPEDVGGAHGYQEFLEVIFQPGHEEFQHYRAWAGNPVHAETFDLKAVNATLSRMRWPVKHRR
jgi:pRiA4b ORF-3-like protein